MTDLDRSGGTASVVGREVELARLDGLAREGRSGRTILVIGDAGLGKTTLWQATVESARARGERVLTARPSGSFAQQPFGGLMDLCDELGEAEFASLPGPQRRALEVALARAEPGGDPTQATVVARGLLGVVRALAARDPALIAIDDLQWLDAQSVEVLTFVARRLEGARVAFLFARRPGHLGALEAVLSRGTIERVELRPLSLGAVRRLLFERLGLTLSRQRMRRIVGATGGNPLFALEVGRALRDSGAGSLGNDVPLPDSLDELLGDRVAGLPEAVRRVLLTVGLSEDPRVDQLVRIIDPEALDDAVDAGVVVVDGGRVRAAHPLLAAAAEKGSRARERRELHLALASAAGGGLVQATHQALACPGPDGPLAARVAAAAEEARVLGARRQAALLATEALRLTPSDGAQRPERVLELAERLDEAGELRRMTELLRQELDSLPAGPKRARAWLLLSESDEVRSRQDQDRHLERALAECGEDRNLRAYVLAKQAGHAAAAGVERLQEAEAWAREALESAEEGMVRRYASWSLAWVLALSGRPVDDLCARSSVATDPTAYISASPERVAAKRLFWRGEMATARDAFDALIALADERGDLTSYAMIRMHKVELELRAGNCAAAEGLLDEWRESSDFETQFRPQYPRCRAMLEAGRGASEEAARWASETISSAQATGSRWDELEARRALGIGALVEPAADRALADMWPVWEHCEREGVLDPGAFPVAPELVEALVELERFDDARAVTGRLRELAVQQEHPWGLVTARRCTAIAALGAEGYSEASAETLLEASADLERLELRFDSARCLLGLGRAQRRSKRWLGARETLERAAATFGELGADGWTRRARSELERVGGRRRADGGLTPSERRVVELAAEGLSNKEIAATLFVAVNTVEVHLARAYAKLGVRSRTQLAKRLAAGS